jgi:phosphatidylserine decarboxylase
MYQLAELVADRALAARLTGGPYATIYLSPRDYHRVHAPVDARILGYDYLPGALWPVNPRVAARRDGLLARNERVVIRMNAGALGNVALVMVGASGVGNIRLAPGLGAVSDAAPWAAPGAVPGGMPDAMPGGMSDAMPGGMSDAMSDAMPDAMPDAMIESAGWRAAREPRRVELSGVTVARGDELGAFRLGSTVVLVFEPHKAELAGEVGQALRFGQRIGRRGDQVDRTGTPGGAS